MVRVASTVLSTFTWISRLAWLNSLALNKLSCTPLASPPSPPFFPPLPSPTTISSLMTVFLLLLKLVSLSLGPRLSGSLTTTSTSSRNSVKSLPTFLLTRFIAFSSSLKVSTLITLISPLSTRFWSSRNGTLSRKWRVTSIPSFHYMKSFHYL